MNDLFLTYITLRLDAIKDAISYLSPVALGAAFLLHSAVIDRFDVGTPEHTAVLKSAKRWSFGLFICFCIAVLLPSTKDALTLTQPQNCKQQGETK